MTSFNRVILTLVLLLALRGPALAAEASRCEALIASAKVFLAEVLEDRYGKELAMENKRKGVAAMEAASEACWLESQQASNPKERAELAGKSILNKVGVFLNRNEWEKAIETLRKGAETVKDLEGDRSPALIGIYETLSGYLGGMYKNYDEARWLLEEALEIRKDAYGPDDLRVVDGLIYLGIFYKPSRRPNIEDEERGADFKIAESYFRDAVRISIAYDGLRLDDILASFIPMLENQGGREDDIRELKELQQRYSR